MARPVQRYVVLTVWGEAPVFLLPVGMDPRVAIGPALWDEFSRYGLPVAPVPPGFEAYATQESGVILSDGETVLAGYMEPMRASLQEWELEKGDVVLRPERAVSLDQVRQILAGKEYVDLTLGGPGGGFTVGNPAPGYQSWQWRQQDWRVVVPGKEKPDVTYGTKCGSKANRTRSGKVRLCLPLYVIQQLRRTTEGKKILWDQAKRKERAAVGQRVSWHPRIRELHAKLERMNEKDDPKLRAARLNSELRFPPAMLADMEAFVRENWDVGALTPAEKYGPRKTSRWAARQRRTIDRARSARETFELDLTGWPYVESRGGPEVAKQTILDSDPHMARIEVIILPEDDAYWAGRNAVGTYRGGRRYGLSRGRHPKIYLMGGRGARDTVRILKHEMRHWTQQLLSILTDRPAGLPRKGAIVGKREERARRLAGIEEGDHPTVVMDPYKLQREYAEALGISQHDPVTASGEVRKHAHARDPVEFYTRMGDLVDRVSAYALQDYATITVWGGRGKHPLWPARPSPQKFFNEYFQRQQGSETIRALKGAFPRRHRKMVSEVYAQAYARFMEELPAVMADPEAYLVASREEGRRWRVKKRKAPRKGKRVVRSKPKKKGPPRKGTILYDIQVAKTAKASFTWTESGGVKATVVYDDGTEKVLYGATARNLRKALKAKMPRKGKRVRLKTKRKAPGKKE